MDILLHIFIRREVSTNCELLMGAGNSSCMHEAAVLQRPGRATAALKLD